MGTEKYVELQVFCAASNIFEHIPHVMTMAEWVELKHFNVRLKLDLRENTDSKNYTISPLNFRQFLHYY